MKTNRKGQAAMEYLMTYGWALLAIVIVIAALIYLNPFRAPELCLFQQQGFSCSEPNPQIYIDKADGELKMNVRIWNKLGKAVEIYAITCTDAQASEMRMDMATQYSGEPIPTGSFADFKGSTASEVACIDREGDPIETFSLNQEFRGRMIVWYNYVDDLDKDIKHEAQANVISLVVEGSSSGGEDEGER